MVNCNICNSDKELYVAECITTNTTSLICNVCKRQYYRECDICDRLVDYYDNSNSGKFLDSSTKEVMHLCIHCQKDLTYETKQGLKLLEGRSIICKK